MRETIWTNLINDLLQRGYTFKTIGDAAGMTGENIRALLANPCQEPRWRSGDAIIKLHSKVMRKYPKVDTVA